MNYTMYKPVYEGAKDWIYENPPKHLPFFFEVADLIWWQNLMLDYWKFPFYVATVYLTLVFGIQAWMKDREPFELRKTLILWNLSMGILNLVGFVRQFQELYPILNKPGGFHRSLCNREELNQPAGLLGTLLFIVLSKVIIF